MIYCAELVFELLFRQHRAELLNFAGRQSNEEIAEDLVQEAYIRLMRQAQTERIDNPRAYLYKIIRNLSADYLRQGKVRNRHFEDNENGLEHIADPMPAPDASIESQARLQCCLDALNDLPEIQRHVFLLHRIDGMTYAEISKALNIPTRTVERYAAKALAYCFAKVQDKF